MRKQKSRKEPAREADLLTPRERGVLSLMREGLNDEQIAERLGIDVATAQYDVWGILSKLGLESRAQVAVARPQPAPAPVVEAPAPVVEAPALVVEAPVPVAEAPFPVVEAPALEVEAAPAPEVEAALTPEVEAAPTPEVEAAPAPEVEAEIAPVVEAAHAPAVEPVPLDPEPEGDGPSEPTAPPRRINLRLAAQVFGLVLALAGLGLIGLGAMRMAANDNGERPLVVRTSLPSQSPAVATTPASTVTPFPTAVPEEPIAFGEFGFRRSLYSIRPDGSDFYTLLQTPPRAYAGSPDGAQLAYVQSYGDTDLKFVSVTGEAKRSVHLDGVFNVEGVTWPDDGSRVVLSVQVAQSSDPSVLKNTIALLELKSGRLAILDSAPLLPNGLITLPGEPAAVVPHPNSGAALSPDGAHVAWPSGDGEIKVAPVDGRTPAVALAGRFPAWSPGGDRLAFQSGGQIHTVNRDGSDEQLLTVGYEPAWAPADSIAFLREGDLFVIDPDTSEETQLTGIDLPYASTPRWSPDGERILFTYAPVSPEIFTVGPNGEGRTLLVPGVHPQWSPDGASIAFASNGSSNGGTIYVMTADSGAITPLPAGVTLNDPAPLDPGCYLRPFQWSPLGDRIAVCNAPSGPIQIVGPGSEPPVLIGSGTSFSWSPDGGRIAFAGSEGEGAGARSVISIADVAQPGSPPERFAEGATPEWSPDGAKIAYVSRDTLRIADLASGDDTVIARGDISRSPVSWAPDTSRIAYTSAGRIFIADLASPDRPTAIAEGLDPKWSPDGTQIAYHTRDAAGHADLWTVPADASSPPRHLGKGRNPSWSPDSARLAYDRFIR